MRGGEGGRGGGTNFENIVFRVRGADAEARSTLDDGSCRKTNNHNLNGRGENEKQNGELVVK